MPVTDTEAPSRPVGAAQVKALVAAADSRDAALVGLLAYGGLMPRQAVALRWQDVDSHSEYLTVPVSARGSAALPEGEPMPMGRDLLDVLATYRDYVPQAEKTSHLFPGTRGTSLTTRSVQRIVKHLTAEVGFPGVTANDLRWFGVDRLRRRIKDDLRVRRMLGLKSITFLDHLDDALRVRRHYQKRARKPAEPADTVKRGGRPKMTERNAILFQWFSEFTASGLGRQVAYRRCATRWNDEHPDTETDRKLQEDAVRKAIKDIDINGSPA